MAGNKAGGAKAAATNKAKYGKDFYHRIGAMGGHAQTTGKGFGSPKVGPDGLTGRQRAKKHGLVNGRNRWN